MMPRQSVNRFPSLIAFERVGRQEGFQHAQEIALRQIAGAVGQERNRARWLGHPEVVTDLFEQRQCFGPRAHLDIGHGRSVHTGFAHGLALCAGCRREPLDRQFERLLLADIDRSLGQVIWHKQLKHFEK